MEIAVIGTGVMVCNGEIGAGSGKWFYDWSDPRTPAPRDHSHCVAGTAGQVTAKLK